MANNLNHGARYVKCNVAVMLYLIHQANHEDLAYRGGQGPIVHLEADLKSVVAEADRYGVLWAFTLSNAGAFYPEFRSDLAALADINWNAVEAGQWAGNGVPSEIREGKQAEFLVQGTFPWNLVSRIGVRSQSTFDRVQAALRNAAHKPKIEIMPNWYY